MPSTIETQEVDVEVEVAAYVAASPRLWPGSVFVFEQVGFVIRRQRGSLIAMTKAGLPQELPTTPSDTTMRPCSIVFF